MVHRNAASIEQRIADICRDPVAAKALMAERSERWRPLHEINVWAIESIAQLLLDSGTDEEWRSKAPNPPVSAARRRHRGSHRQLDTCNGDPQQQQRAAGVLEAYWVDRNTVRATSRRWSSRRVRGRHRASRRALRPRAVFPRRQEIQRVWLQTTGELQLLKGRPKINSMRC